MANGMYVAWLAIGGAIIVIAFYILETGNEAFEHIRIDCITVTLRQQFAQMRAPPRGIPVPPGERDDAECVIEAAGQVQVVKRRQQLGRREVARRAENHKVTGARHDLPASFSACPPKPLRIIASTLAA